MISRDFGVVGILVVLLCTPGVTQNENSRFKNCTGRVEFIEDGQCDVLNNIESCSYDGGDCCPCTCMDGLEYKCGSNGFDCKDEACLDQAIVDQFPDCPGVLLHVGDGDCHGYNNLPECGYDGGDCCMCTCFDAVSCQFIVDCIDPGAGDEIYACEIPPHDEPLPCSAEVEHSWIVKDAGQAQALAGATNCSGGSFDVEWIGNISTNETIWVVDGTVLNITGSSSGATMTGSLNKRLITVVNASLHLRGVSVNFGSALAGGAIAASASSLILNQTSFVGNTAEGIGGALYLVNGSTVTFDGDTTIFYNNSAVGSGGAVYIGDGSVVFWNGRKTLFADNISQKDGGAVTVQSESTASWSGNVIFANNVGGGRGGAVYVRNYATVAWNGSTHFSNNTAFEKGGAVMVSKRSNASWEGEMTFVQNVANRNEGGGLFVGDRSILSWEGETQFVRNRAGSSGGAMAVALSSDAIGSGNTMYVHNGAGANGGALLVGDNSTISWSGNSGFVSNIANDGGAILLDSSQVVWSDTATFLNNSAQEGVGGAIYVREQSTATWKSATTFTRNSGGAGGAVYVDSKSSVYYNGITSFVGNVAGGEYGGAVSVSSSSVLWRNGVTFVGNTAASFGGAVSFFAEISASDSSSSLVLAGPILFANNTCNANGGALSLVGGVIMTLETTNITFTGNRAEISGGAIYMWGNDLGPTFIGVNFISNYAQHGGAVYSTGSGNALISLNGEHRSNPVVFEGCRFTENQAVATGGAIQSAAGQEKFVNTFFSRNKAVEGGALNLAGTALLENCTFEENISDEGRGPVGSNIGYISSISNCSFIGTAYSCKSSTFLVYKSSHDLFEVICKGCNKACEECFFERSSGTPTCTETMENSYSPGGLTTLNLVSINPGYWRATTSSQAVLACYNSDACLGGMTGARDYCLDGYEGPYCAICKDGYSPSLGFVCNECSKSPGGIALAIILTLVILAALNFMATYLLSTNLERGMAWTLVERVMRYIPLQSVKIVIVAWQIVTQFISVANIQYPYVYQRFLDGVKLLEFDLGWMLSASCVVDIGFHDRLIFATVGPIAVIALLGLTLAIALRRSRRSPRAVQNVKHRHLSVVLLLTFFVYSNVSSIIFQTFACEHLEDGKYYLRADYRIECDSGKHINLQMYAGFMAMLYTVGIPVFYAILLFRNRDVLVNKDSCRNRCSRISSTSSLWRPYKPTVFYFEVIECARRVLLAGAVVFFNPNTASQIAVTLILAFAFAIISESLDPYMSKWDTWLSRTGHMVVYVSVYVALLLKVDVSTESHDSQKAFEVVLVLFNVCMIAAVVTESSMMACSVEYFSTKRQEGDNTKVGIYPRFKPMRWPLGRDVPVSQEMFEAQACCRG